MEHTRLSSALTIVITLVGLSVGEKLLGKNSWVFLVGGNPLNPPIMDYLQQANVAHSYHMMIAAGVPPDRIIVMMDDSAAYSPQNPMRGVLVNRPNGPNVLEGVKIDYSGKDLTAANFLNVLSGNKEAMKGAGTGRVIESDADTNIFVFFSDHGNVGLLYFGLNDRLYAHELHDTLKVMHQKKLYKKVVLYIEACFSGSMFDNLLEENIGVYAITAAARDESACAWYCDESKKNSSLPDVCLGGEFSIKWLEYMDRAKTGTQSSLFHQFEYMREQVVCSHVNIYGDFSFGYDVLTPNAHSPAQNWIPTHETTPFPRNTTHEAGVSSALAYYRRRAERTQDPEDWKRVDNLIEGHEKAEELFERLIEIAVQDEELRTDIINEYLQLRRDIFPCYKDLVSQFINECFKPIEYFRKHFHKFANLCVKETDVTELKQQMASVCAPYKASINTDIFE